MTSTRRSGSETRATRRARLLGRAFDTAVALRDAGLEFVVAPIRTGSGEALRRLGSRHTIALFPFVDGHAGRYGQYEDGAQAAVVAMLAELHGATDAVGSTPPRIGLDLRSRRHLEAGLEELDETWSGGPFSEPARHVFAGLASDVVDFLSAADRLAAEVEKRGSAWVITHGEPHAANVMRTGTGHVLVDWDTAAVAPRERDLWMLVEDGTEDLLAYTDATGHGIDQDALSFFRLAWDLNDVAEYLHELRSPHRESADTRAAYQGLTSCMPSRERWSELLD